MTPQEKAKELVGKYINPFNRNGCIPPYETIFNSTAKQCALIAVDEIINTPNPMVNYWQKVKHEIQNL